MGEAGSFSINLRTMIGQEDGISMREVRRREGQKKKILELFRLIAPLLRRSWVEERGRTTRNYGERSVNITTTDENSSRGEEQLVSPESKTTTVALTYELPSTESETENHQPIQLTLYPTYFTFLSRFFFFAS